MLITRPWALYNEIEEYAADWLENLIRLGVIAPGVVDRRSIEDLRGDDLREFRQCHFFAGIGVWSYALRCAGVPDDAPLWTGSCPCQPFSAAGKGTGVDDERHLWPAWFHLIQQERPPRIYGEQVASKDGLGWLDVVLADMEAEDYSIWAVDTCSAGSGAPHIRQRLRFRADDLRSATSGMEHTSIYRSQGRLRGWSDQERRTLDGSTGCHSAVERLADDLDEQRPNGQRGIGTVDEAGGRLECAAASSGLHSTGGMVDSDGRNASAEWQQRCGEQRQQQEDCSGVERLANDNCDRLPETSIGRVRHQEYHPQPRSSILEGQPGPTNGFWRDADWLFCRDGQWRPIEPGTFPLVDGSAFRVGSGSAFEGKSRQGMLKGYGNAVDLQATIDFIEATLEPDVIDAVRGGSDEPCQSPLELYTRTRRDTEDLA